MPNTFVDPYTYSKIVALAVFQDIGVSALSGLHDFMENGGSKLLTNSLAQYCGYVGASCVNNAVTPAILLPIIDNGVRACNYIQDDPSPRRVAAVAMTYSLSALLAAEADVPVNLAMSGLLVAFSQFMVNAITAGGASIVCKDSILKNSIKCQLFINQLPLAHQRILNVLLLGFDLALIIVFVKTIRKRLRYYKRFFKKSYNVSKNVIKTIKTKAAEVKINRQGRIKYKRQQKLLMLEKCYNL